MAKKFTNLKDLKVVIQKQMQLALEEATKTSFEDLKENVEYFYDSPEGRYKRTGQLKASPQLDGINHNGDTSISQISINTSTQYYPAGRDTHQIYNYAENDELIGNGGFWRKTTYDIEENIEKSFKKRFD